MRYKHPLYTYLKSQKGDKIKWNFTKFLIDREGNVVERFESKVTPAEISTAVEKILQRRHKGEINSNLSAYGG